MQISIGLCFGCNCSHGYEPTGTYVAKVWNWLVGAPPLSTKSSQMVNGVM